MSNDILNSLANLSNDEVFTSAKVANKLLDRIPDDFWSKIDAKVLNPFMKTGIFLREIITRFDKGLMSQIKDKKKRVEHILKNICFGIPITKMTSLISKRTVYTSRYANGKYSLGEDVFDDEDGNILFTKTEHQLGNDKKCIICKMGGIYDDEFETYAYPFIHHNQDWKKVKDMKFDLIIGNPPYQVKDGEGGGGASAKPIYQHFVKEAIAMKPDHLLMVIPSRWYGGGKGLDKFREEMLGNKHIKEIHDFENEKILFPSIQLKGGVNFFYIEKNFTGDTKFFSYNSLDDFKEYNIKSMNTKIGNVKTGIFIRNQFAIKIFNKIWTKNYSSLENTISSCKPFGLRSNELGSKKRSKVSNIIVLGRSKSRTYIDKNDSRLKNIHLKDKYKVGLPKAVGNALMVDKSPNTIIASPGEIFTETYIMKTFENKEQCMSFISFINTNIFRFLFNSARYSHNTTKSSYRWIPELSWDLTYSNELLCEKFNITKDEYKLILTQLGENNE